MNNEDKRMLTKRVLERYELYKLNHSRILRLCKDPLRTLGYYILNLISRIRPFRISTKTLWGDEISFYLPEGNQIYYYGFWEANLTNFLVKYLTAGKSFVDIGAHVGFYTLLASRLVEKEGSVFALEPTPRTFSTLKDNCKNFDNIHIFNLAASDNNGTQRFTDYGPKFSAFNTFEKRTGSEMNFLKNSDKEITVETVEFDTWAQERKIQPDFIKIDAEGVEYLILKGMKHALANQKTIFSIEVSGNAEWEMNCQKSIEIFLTDEYSLFEATAGGYLVKHVVKQTYGYDNLICVPNKMIDGLKSFMVS